MSNNTDFELLKEKKLSGGAILKITKNIMSGRIFVEFTSNDPRIVLQKNFPDSLDGKKKSQKFSKSIKSMDQLKEYFGIKGSR